MRNYDGTKCPYDKTPVHACLNELAIKATVCAVLGWLISSTCDHSQVWSVSMSLACTL